jgi:hypothetical protein
MGGQTVMRRSATVYFASYGLSLLGKGIASVVMPLLVLERTGDVLAAGVLAAVATAAGLPVAGAVLAVLAGVTAVAALVAPVFRSLDDPRGREPVGPEGRPRPRERSSPGLALADTVPRAPDARTVEEHAVGERAERTADR